jgi:hypothetical protein
VNGIAPRNPLFAWDELADPVSVKSDNLRACEEVEVEAERVKEVGHPEEHRSAWVESSDQLQTHPEKGDGRVVG